MPEHFLGDVGDWPMTRYSASFVWRHGSRYIRRLPPEIKHRQESERPAARVWPRPDCMLLDLPYESYIGVSLYFIRFAAAAPEWRRRHRAEWRRGEHALSAVWCHHRVLAEVAGGVLTDTVFLSTVDALRAVTSMEQVNRYWRGIACDCLYWLVISCRLDAAKASDACGDAAGV